MQPTRTIWEQLQNLLAADTTTFAAALAMHLHLANNNFTPSLDLALSGLTEATFTGSAKLNVGTGTQKTYYDVSSGFRVIELLEPAGGWHWTCTVTPAAPETIYGAYLTDNADAVLYGSMKLSSPLTISQAGQGIDIGYIQLSFITNSPF